MNDRNPSSPELINVSGYNKKEDSQQLFIDNNHIYYNGYTFVIPSDMIHQLVRLKQVKKK